MSKWSIYKNGGASSLIDSNTGVVQEHRIVLTLKNLGGSVDDQSFGSVGIVTGYMKKPFTYSTNAQYSKIFSVDMGSLIPRLIGNMAADYTQRNLPMDTGYLSKKVFDPQASYLKLDLEFRIYDDPAVIDKCDLLATCCWPIANKNLATLATDPQDAIGNVIKAPFLAFSNAAGAGVAAGQTSGFGAGAGTFVRNLYLEGAGAFTTKMPPHVDVQIGSYFERLDMVISNVDITFSQEFTRSGGHRYPTFADISIGIESLYGSVGIDDSNSKNEKTFGSGFKVGNNASRRVIVDKSTKSNFVEKGFEDIVQLGGIILGGSGE